MDKEFSFFLCAAAQREKFSFFHIHSHFIDIGHCFHPYNLFIRLFFCTLDYITRYMAVVLFFVFDFFIFSVSVWKEIGEKKKKDFSWGNEEEGLGMMDPGNLEIELPCYANSAR